MNRGAGTQIRLASAQSSERQLGVEVLDQGAGIDSEFARVVAHEPVDIGSGRQCVQVFVLDRLQLSRMQSDSRSRLLHAQARAHPRLRQCVAESGRRGSTGTLGSRRLRLDRERFIH